MANTDNTRQGQGQKSGQQQPTQQPGKGQQQKQGAGGNNRPDQDRKGDRK